jgi:hypothetical protein
MELLLLNIMDYFPWVVIRVCLNCYSFVLFTFVFILILFCVYNGLAVFLFFYLVYLNLANYVYR